MREELAMRARLPVPVLLQSWTVFLFLYVEAYFRLEHLLVTTSYKQQWMYEFNEMFNVTFMPYNISADQLRRKYADELIGYMNCKPTVHCVDAVVFYPRFSHHSLPFCQLPSIML
jgi:hypothetical protein